MNKLNFIKNTLIGKGQFGEVYSGIYIKTKELVALKYLKVDDLYLNGGDYLINTIKTEEEESENEGDKKFIDDDNNEEKEENDIKGDDVEEDEEENDEGEEFEDNEEKEDDIENPNPAKKKKTE